MLGEPPLRFSPHVAELKNLARIKSKEVAAEKPSSSREFSGDSLFPANVHQKRTGETSVGETDRCRFTGNSSTAKLAACWKRRRSSVESTGTFSDGTVATIYTQFSDPLNRSSIRPSSFYSTELDTSNSTRPLDASHSTLNDASSYLGRSCSELDASDSDTLTQLMQQKCQANSHERPRSEGKEGHHGDSDSCQFEFDTLNDPHARNSGDWKSPGFALGPADPSTFDDDKSSLAVDISFELSEQINNKRQSSLQTIKSVEESRQSFVGTILSLGDLDLESLGSFDDLEKDLKLKSDPL